LGFPANKPRQARSSGVLFFQAHTMRTYDKLIATILLAKARDGLRSYFGTLLQAP